METDSYDLDHIIPISRGGTNELSNLGVAIPIANKSKSTDLSNGLLLV